MPDSPVRPEQEALREWVAARDEYAATDPDDAPAFGNAVRRCIEAEKSARAALAALDGEGQGDGLREVVTLDAIEAVMAARDSRPPLPRELKNRLDRHLNALRRAHEEFRREGG